MDIFHGMLPDTIGKRIDYVLVGSRYREFNNVGVWQRNCAKFVICEIHIIELKQIERLCVDALAVEDLRVGGNDGSFIEGGETIKQVASTRDQRWTRRNNKTGSSSICRRRKVGGDQSCNHRCQHGNNDNPPTSLQHAKIKFYFHFFLPFE